MHRSSAWYMRFFLGLLGLSFVLLLGGSTPPILLAASAQIDDAVLEHLAAQGSARVLISLAATDVITANVQSAQLAQTQDAVLAALPPPIFSSTIATKVFPLWLAWLRRLV